MTFDILYYPPIIQLSILSVSNTVESDYIASSHPSLKTNHPTLWHYNHVYNHTYNHILDKPSPPFSLSNNSQIHRNANIHLRLTEHKLIDPRPPAVRNMQQFLRKIAHKEPRDRLLRTVHHDADPAVCERQAVSGRDSSPLAAGLDQHGGVEVREGPGSRFCAKFSTSAKLLNKERLDTESDQDSFLGAVKGPASDQQSSPSRTQGIAAAVVEALMNKTHTYGQEVSVMARRCNTYSIHDLYRGIHGSRLRRGHVVSDRVSWCDRHSRISCPIPIQSHARLL